MFLQRPITICREGWYYLLLLAFVFTSAFLGQINLILIVGGMMTGPLFFSWRAVTVALKNLEVRRRVPGGISAGDSATVEITASNTRRRGGSWAIAVEDVVRREANYHREEPLPAAVLFSHIPAGQTRTMAYRGHLTRRGRYRFGPLRVSTRFPLGLLRRTIVVPQVAVLTVYPRVGRLTRRWAQLHQEAYLGNRTMRRQHGLVEGDFYGLRDWRSGDSRRWIHWRSSARRRGLVVRQFEQHRNQDLALLLDLWQPGRPGPDHLATVERAVSLAATIVADLCRQEGSDLVAAVGGQETAFLRGPVSMALRQDVMESLATAEAGPHDRLPELLARVGGTPARNEYGSRQHPPGRLGRRRAIWSRVGRSCKADLAGSDFGHRRRQ
ncbi:MAG: DUF58 domain-containing protein [Pirellulales bacterium]